MADSRLNQSPTRRSILASVAAAIPAAAVAAPLTADFRSDDAEERLQHHLKGAAEAVKDLFPGVPVVLRGNVLDGAHDCHARQFTAEPDERGRTACALLMASWGMDREADRV